MFVNNDIDILINKDNIYDFQWDFQTFHESLQIKTTDEKFVS